MKFLIQRCSKLWYKKSGVFSVILPVKAVATATSVFTEYVFCESVDSAHNSQISSTFEEADFLTKLVKVNKQVFAITLFNINFNHTA